MAVVTHLREGVWLFVGIVVSALLFQTVFERMPKGVPITYHSLEVVQPSVPRGGTLLVRVRVTRHRSDCELTVNRFVVNDAGEVQLLPATTEVPLIEAGDRTLIVGIPLPHRFAPGRYTYRAATAYDCPDGRYLVRTEPAPFEIVPDEGDPG